jgi:alcohol dehydrogenase
MNLLEQQPRTRVLFGPGTLDQLGTLAAELGFRRTLLVTDRGLVQAGHFAHAARLLQAAGISVAGFHDFAPNPDTRCIEAGRDAARAAEVDSLIGLGGGSSMDCAKAINFLVTNGGRMQDYAGYGKASRPMLPMIGIPTTTGTGSEAQSYALVSDAETHVKMACGDPKAAFRIAILDPQLAVSQPAAVRAMTGYDALSHAVETFVTTRRNPASEAFSREAWRLLSIHYERALAEPSNLEVQGAMLLGAHYAGAAIEHSMLGAAHACANPLTARYGTIHGAAIALLLAHVVRWNGAVAGEHYAELAGAANGSPQFAAETLARRLEQLAAAGNLRTRLSAAGVPRADLPALAEAAAQQWTGQFNPRPFSAAGALEVYQSAY